MNDDHMDELFRKAAGEYPLDTRGSNWNKVAGQLQIPAHNRNHRRLWWLLLLLPLPFLCHHLEDRMDPKEADTQAATTPAQTHSKDLSRDRSVANTPNIEAGPAQTNDKESASETVRNTNASTAGKSAGSGSVIKLANKPNTIQPVSGNARVHQRHDARSNSKSRIITTGQTGMLPVTETGGEPLLARSSEPPAEAWLSSRAGPVDPRLLEHTEPMPQVTPGDPVPEPPVPSTDKEKKRFYAGLMGGVDATTIRFQKVEKAGYDLGVLLGYELTSRLSVESGLFYNKKFYYSNGEHYKGDLYLPPATTLLDLEGSCRMWEIPLSLRYAFQKGKASSWFATGGLSSYIMNRQDYALNYYYAQSGQTSKHPYTYEESVSYWFAVMHLSVGYTRELGKLGSLRIEPYIKLPIRNVGVGEFPLHSAGLRFGITRRLF